MTSKRKLLPSIRRADRNSIHKRVEKIRDLERLLNLDPLWQIYPDLEVDDNSQGNDMLDALGEFTQDVWRQALRCYVDSSYIGCVVLSSCTIESALKHQLLKVGNYNLDVGLGRCITECQRNDILPNIKGNEIVVAAWMVNNARNSIMHANIPRTHPEAIIYSEAPEHLITEIGAGIQNIEQFRNLARDTLVNSTKILNYLIPENTSL